MAEKKRDPRISVRVAVIVELGSRVLLALHERDGREYWVFPGGRLEYGETLEECARRELKEEANIDVRIGPLLYVSDRTSGKRQDVNLFFQGCLEEGEIRLGNDPEDRGNKILKRLTLASAEELLTLEVLPPEVKIAVLDDWTRDFPVKGRYLCCNE
jgi:8-oxo-dGTP diphosphatase